MGAYFQIDSSTNIFPGMPLPLPAAEPSQPASSPAPIAAPSAAECAPAAEALASPAAAPECNDDLACVLSPSQCNTWCNCPAAWFFRYFRNLPDTCDGNRTVGIAVHAALAANFRQKIETKKDFTREELFEAYSAAWKEAAAKATLAADDDVAELERTGLILAQKYLLEAAPEIQPAAVELAVTGEIGGVAVRGYVDLLDVNGCIVDLKTASKKPSAMRASQKLQLTIYTLITPGASGQCRIDTTVKTKTQRLVQHKYTVTKADVRYAETMLSSVQAAARAGVYTPHRESMFCNRSKCAYWRACEEEFGGEVPGAKEE